MRLTGRYNANSRFGAANLVTALRATLAVMIASWLVRPAAGSMWLVILLTAVFAGLDGVDGWLARRTGTTSEFGARFDMETDAALILVLSLLVWQTGKAGPWVLLCGLMRYLFVAAGYLLPWMAAPLSPTWRGKTVAVLQFLGLGIALAPPLLPPASRLVAAATVGALCWSFAVDIRRLWMGKGEA